MAGLQLRHSMFLARPHMIDEATFVVKAGNGGDGAVSFRREKYAPKGGPDGGDGGGGESIYLVSDPNINTLRFFAGKDKFQAQHGGAGSKAKRHGQDGEDLIIKVPIGTLINRVEDDKNIPVADLDKPNQKVLIAAGGKGGRGNWHFRSATNQVPRHSEPGTKGEKWQIKLELKVLAQVGLVGLPNAGKSTLLSVLTKAKPEIANYPFTTLSPNLGVLEVRTSQRSMEVGTSIDLVVADIPGLIEGAHQGKGLGIKFLKHIERCQLLVYVLFPQDHQLELSAKQLTNALKKQFNEVKEELKLFDQKLIDLPSLIVLNKTDLLSETQLKDITNYLKKHKIKPLLISAATKQGIEELTQEIVSLYAKISS